MKQTTKEWFLAAEDDLIAAQKLSEDERLSNVVAFHCQQCLEKCFKAVIEELGKPSIKSHDLIRLLSNASIQLSDTEFNLLAIINEVYIDARYPGDLGLLPQGKPTLAEIKTFVDLCELLFKRLREQ